MNYQLEERLDCLCCLRAKLYDFRHVIDEADPIVVSIQNEIDNIINQLEDEELHNVG